MEENVERNLLRTRKRSKKGERRDKIRWCESEEAG